MHAIIHYNYFIKN